MKVRAVGLAVLAAGVLAGAVARADEDTIRTVAGRGIGDGRAATAASLFEPTGVAIGADGAILPVDTKHHRIRRVDPTSGTITTLAGTFEGTLGDGSTPDTVQLKSPVRALALASGDLIIVERGGDALRRIRKDTGLVDTLVLTAGPADPTLLQPNDVDQLSNGDLLVADMGHHRVVRITPLGAVSVFAGNGTPGFAGDVGQAANAQLNFPACVAVAPGDVVYICDKANHRIRMVNNGIIGTVAGNGTPGFSGDGTGPTIALHEPEDAVVDGGDLVFSDQENNRLRRMNRTTLAVTTIAGTGPSGFGGDNVQGASSTLAAPMGLARASDGRILFAERDANRIRALAPDGTLTTVAGDGISTFGGDNGPALDATFRLVEGVAEDASGDLFISDSGNNRIRKVDGATGTVTTLAGNGTTTFGVDGVPATVVGLDSPSDVVVDANGNVIFSDTQHHRVRSVDTQGTIHTIIGNGVPGFGGDGGPASAAQIASPTGLALDAAGNLYVADFGNNRIRKIDTAGNVQTVAGDGNPGFNGDGLAATATSLNSPTDVAFDASGNMFIADMRNHRVRRLDAASGTIGTIAGTGQALSSDDFIPAVTASLVFPTDVAVDADGNVLIADSGSNRIRRVSANGVIDSVAGSRTPGYSGDGGPALQARVLTPLRIHMGPSGRLFIVDHDNGVIRAVGDGGPGGGGGGNGDPDCTQGTCMAGGGSKKTDCFLEFRTGLSARGNKVFCKDGDPTCDRDDTPGQCTVAVQTCFGVQDPRLARCTPAGVKSVQLLQPKPTGKAGSPDTVTALLGGLGAYAPSTVGGGGRPLVAFNDTVTGCTPPMNVLVRIGRKKGKTPVRMIATTAGSGRLARDPDTIVVVCTK